MKTFGSILQLAALGALSAAACAAIAADPSQWKCESCPFEKAQRTGSVDVGVIGVSDDSATFGDYTGLNQQGAYFGLGGSFRYRDEKGVWGNLVATDLGLDTRSIDFDGGREGLYTFRLGYSEIPRHQLDGARTPFLGNGGGRLTLPGGFPAADTGSMPLATTLQPIDVESKRRRFDAGLTWAFGDQWSTQLSFRRDVRDGLQRIGGSFFSTASHLAAPLDQTTDQLELMAAYTTPRLQATVAYQLSVFRNNEPSLTWSNPFLPVVAGADTGQLALPPDNQAHQLVATLGYELTPTVRFSGSFAYGWLSQDESFLPSTANASLAPSVPPLPAQSLNGDVETLNASARLTAKVLEGLNLNASYERNTRVNETPRYAFPSVQTDMFVDPTTLRVNQPFKFFQDRFRIGGDYRRPGSSLKTSFGVDQDYRERSLQEVVTTRETLLWGRVEGRALENLLLQAKLEFGERDGDVYGTSLWIEPPQNPLMRKFNMADRRRQSAGGRADFNATEGITVGVSADYANDDFNDTTIGLTEARTYSFGADFSAALTETTQLYGFAHGERIRSDLANSQTFSAPDWTARSEDRTDTLGLGLKQMLMGGRLQLSADLGFTRMYNDVTVDTGAASAFPTAKTSIDRFRLRAAYQLQKNLTLVGSWWYERYDSEDWRFDGVTPSTIFNLLAFGEPSPRYKVNVLQLGVRYGF